MARVVANHHAEELCRAAMADMIDESISWNRCDDDYFLTTVAMISGRMR